MALNSDNNLSPISPLIMSLNVVFNNVFVNTSILLLITVLSSNALIDLLMISSDTGEYFFRELITLITSFFFITI